MDGGRRAGRAVNVEMLRVAEHGGWKSQAHGWRETGGKGSECTDAEGGRSLVCNMLLTLSHTLLQPHHVESDLNTQLFLYEQGADSWMAYLCVCVCVCLCVCVCVCLCVQMVACVEVMKKICS